MSWGRVGILVETFIFILFFQVPQRFKCQTRDETFFYLQSLILKVSSWSLTSLIPLCQTPPNAYGPILHKIETKFTINSKPVFNQITYSYFVFLATFRFKFPYSLISKPLLMTTLGLHGSFLSNEKAIVLLPSNSFFTLLKLNLIHISMLYVLIMLKSCVRERFYNIFKIISLNIKPLLSILPTNGVIERKHTHFLEVARA